MVTAKKSTKKKVSKKTTKTSPIIIPPDSFSHSGVEIYKTKDKNIEKTKDNEEKEGFVLQNGTITEMAYFDEIVSDSFEHDYEDISSNGSVNFVEVDETRFYKGKKILLKKAYDSNKWDDLENCLLGFITEQSYTDEGVELKIAGVTKLLDQEKQFTYKKTKISKILKDMIESAGLKAKIDTSGLKDVKVDYTNVSSSGSGSTGESQSVIDFVNKTIGNETDDLNKLKKIHYALCDKIKYTNYECSRYSTAEECLKSLKLNCANSSMLAASCYRAAGLTCYVIHGNYHFWVVVTINGTKYASDVSGHHDLNEVWGNNTPFKGKNCGDNPDC